MADWLAYVRSYYGVDPVVFALLYFVLHVGLFYGALYHAARQLRAGRREVAWTALFVALAGYLSPYIYVQAVGRNLPTWIQGLIITFVVLSLCSASHEIRRRLRA